MGTNYYHRTAFCYECGRFDTRHICKNRVLFEAVVEWPDTAPYEPVVVVGCWQEWKARLLELGGDVEDEYGRVESIPDFIAAVEATDPENRGQRQEAWMVEHAPEQHSLTPHPDKSWLDAEGFSFSGSGFS